MSIDLSKELPVTLAEAARTMPGGAVHVSTIHRWRLKGIRGIRLETFLRGGIRCTTADAVSRFFAATTSAADGEAPAIQTTRRRKRDIETAEHECQKAGI